MENIFNFLYSTFTSAAFATALLLFIATLARKYIYEQLTAGIQHDFNVRIESVRAEAKEREALLQAKLKLQDTQLQAELRLRDQQLQLLQSGIISPMTSRQAAVDSRRLDAIDALWVSFNKFSSLRFASRLMESINYKEAMEKSSIDQNTRSFFAELEKMSGIKDEQFQEKIDDSHWKSRLYVSENVWMIFNAYKGVLIINAIRLKQLAAGVKKDLTEINKSISEVKEVLPHQSKFLDDHGPDVLPMLVDELGAAFEREMRKMLNHEPSDFRNIEKVGNMMLAAEKFYVNNKIANLPSNLTKDT